LVAGYTGLLGGGNVLAGGGSDFVSSFYWATGYSALTSAALSDFFIGFSSGSVVNDS